MATRIMIVDDEYIIRLGLVSMLDWERHGYTVCATAQDGADALAKIPAAKPDIILTDVLMKPMDGLTLLEKCRELYPRIRFLLLSNYTDFPFVKRALQLGADDYIFKLELEEEGILRALEDVRARHFAVPATGDESSRFYVRHSAAETLLSHQPAAAGAVNGRLGAALSFQNYRILLVRAHIFSAPSSPPHMLKQALQNLLEDVLASHPGACVFWRRDLDYLVYLEASADSCGQLFTQMRGEVEKYLSGCAVGAMSGVLQGTAAFAQGVAVCDEMLEQTFYDGQTPFFTCGTAFGERPSREALHDFCEKVKQAVLQERAEACSVLCGAFFEDLERRRPPPELVKKDVLFAAEYLFREVERTLAGLGAAPEKSALPELPPSGGSCEGPAFATLQGLKKWFEGCLQALFALSGPAVQRREIVMAKNYVSANLEQKITLPMVARYVNLNESYFSHLFKKEMGCNFIDHVNSQKIERAKVLLRQTDLKVNEISAQLGFENANYFNILFKRLAGTSPNAYRNEGRSKPQ